MTLHFHITYTCVAGESLYVRLYTLPDKAYTSLRLETLDGENHIARFELATAKQVSYR